MPRKAKATGIYAVFRIELYVKFCGSILMENYKYPFAQCTFRIIVMSYCYDKRYLQLENTQKFANGGK